MIAGIRIKNFKAIRELNLPYLEPFHVLVGPNGSGKSTFLDAIEFVRAMLTDGPRRAIEARAPAYRDLTFRRNGGPVDLNLTVFQSGSYFFYDVSLDHDQQSGVRVVKEKLTALDTETRGFSFGTPDQLLLRRDGEHHSLVERDADGRSVWFNVGHGETWRFSPDRLSLSQIPADTDRFPAALLARSGLTEGIVYLRVDPDSMREPSPVTQPADLLPNGSNLARVVGKLLRNDHDRKTIEDWCAHLRFAIPDLSSVRWAQRESDNAEYIVLVYRDGFECPAWLLSDGTLRMLALTILPFLPNNPARTYLIEEPENGVHPYALEAVLRALESIPDSSVFATTHSPLVVREVGHQKLLCFENGPDGVTAVRGVDHPVLKNWDGTPDLETIFESRVLG